MSPFDYADRCYSPDPTPSHVEPRWDAATDPPVSEREELEERPCWLCNPPADRDGRRRERETNVTHPWWQCPGCGGVACDECHEALREAPDEGCATCAAGIERVLRRERERRGA